jgi:hypothetical protein
MCFLIIPFAFLLAMRGTRPAPLQKPVQGLERVWREAVDFFLTASLVLALWTFAGAVERIPPGVREHAILGFGITAYLVSHYQKKTDVFFLSVLASVFMISSKQHNLSHEILLAGIVSAAIAVFQTCFLGLRYKLLFSNVPPSMKGWPILCLLAGWIALVLRGLGGLVF